MRALLLVLALAACGSNSSTPSNTTPKDPAQGSAAASACVPTGCSNTLCVEPGKEVMTTCEYKPEYACYQKAECKRQADGQCGWTQTPELTSCLQNPPAAP